MGDGQKEDVNKLEEEGGAKKVEKPRNLRTRKKRYQTMKSRRAYQQVRVSWEIPLITKKKKKEKKKKKKKKKIQNRQESESVLKENHPWVQKKEGRKLKELIGGLENTSDWDESLKQNEDNLHIQERHLKVQSEEKRVAYCFGVPKDQIALLADRLRFRQTKGCLLK